MPRVKHVHNFQPRTFRIGLGQGISGYYCECGREKSMLELRARLQRLTLQEQMKMAVAILRPGPRS